MNRISRRSADEAADALLEVGRTQPVLHYDVEVGLARHHHWMRSEAPLPEWATAAVGGAASSLVPVAIKVLLSAVLLGGAAVAAWQARERPQPAARAPAVVEPAQVAAPSAPDATDSDAWLARTPLPVADPGLGGEPPARRATHDRRTTRAARSHRAQLSAARVESAPVEPATPSVRAADRTPDRAQPAPTAPSRASEEPGAARVATPEPRSHGALAEPAPQAQGPSDLAEMQQVAKAEQLLSRSPERALALVRQGEQRFAGGYFQQERAYIAIMALIRLGRIEEARVRAAGFARQFPALPYGARIRSALAAASSTP